jgi:hypothetical protein
MDFFWRLFFKCERFVVEEGWLFLRYSYNGGKIGILDRFID